MAKRKQRNPGVVIGIALLFAIGVFVWYGMTRLGWRIQKSVDTTPPKVAVDTSNDGKRVTLTGKLTAPAAARDVDLNVGVDTVGLLRTVEMYQWREQCSGNDCRYDLEWSAKPIDASKFRTPAGHDNPKFPFTSARFATGPIRLQGYVVDPELVNDQVTLEKFPVHATQLPANLAATFREVDGVLVAGDPAHPQPGALRVSYRIVPTGDVKLSGVQHGQRLSTN